MQTFRHRCGLRGRLGVVAAVATVCVATAIPLAAEPGLREPAIAIAIMAVFAVSLWRGASVFLAAPMLAALLALAASGTTPISYFEFHFARPVGAFVAEFLPLFVLSAIFGRALADSGCAASLGTWLADTVPRAWAPVAVAALCALLTLGGVGVFVIAFSVYPIARAMFRKAGVPLHLAPAAIALGAFTFAMTALPGAPSLTNIVLASSLGTTAFAAPVKGFVASVLIAVPGALWLRWRAAHSEHVHDPDVDGLNPMPTPAPLIALCPLLLTVVLNGFLTWRLPVWAPGGLGAMGASYWAVIIALFCGTLAVAFLAGRARPDSWDAGAVAAAGPLLATGVGYGFGLSVAYLPGVADGFAAVSGHLAEAPLAHSVLTSGLYAGIVGSSSGGLLLWRDLHAAEALASAAAPDILHRLAALASGILDTLPHSGAVIALLTICRVRHSVAYLDVGVVSIVAPLAGLCGAFAFVSLTHGGL